MTTTMLSDTDAFDAELQQLLESDRDVRSTLQLRGGRDGVPWFLSAGARRLCMAVTESGGYGAGWFRVDDRLDPAVFGFESIPTAEILGCAERDRAQVVALTLKMIATCLVDGYTAAAGEMAGALIDGGHRIGLVGQAGPGIS